MAEIEAWSRVGLCWVLNTLPAWSSSYNEKGIGNFLSALMQKFVTGDVTVL
jgi:hypothetical protein